LKYLTRLLASRQYNNLKAKKSFIFQKYMSLKLQGQGNIQEKPIHIKQTVLLLHIFKRVVFALKGQHIIAQGNALGNLRNREGRYGCLSWERGHPVRS
jgi:hypothetical protein